MACRKDRKNSLRRGHFANPRAEFYNHWPQATPLVLEARKPANEDFMIRQRHPVLSLPRRTVLHVRDWLVANGWLETAMLGALLFLILGACAFAAVADGVVAGESQRFDERVLVALRSAENPGTPIGPEWLALAALDLTALGGFAVIALASLAALGLLALQRKWGALGLVFVSIVGGAGVSVVLKAFFDRARPQVVPHLVQVSSPSFPSGHSMLAAVTYLTLGALLARTARDWRSKCYIFGVALALTVVIGLTRIYLGVHYPTDVLAGWFAGITWALACNLVARRLQRSGLVEGRT
jgi:undecaprenyl-diphosphatase